MGGGGYWWDRSGLGKDRWLGLVNVVMNLWVPQIQGISWLAGKQLASQEGLCSTVQVSNKNQSMTNFSLLCFTTDHFLWLHACTLPAIHHTRLLLFVWGCTTHHNGHFLITINSMSPFDFQKGSVTSWYRILIGNWLIDIVHSVQHIILLGSLIIRSYTRF